MGTRACVRRELCAGWGLHIGLCYAFRGGCEGGGARTGIGRAYGG